MNILELMDSKYKSYTNTDLYIYDRCKKNLNTFAESSIGNLTDFYGVSQASLTRFAKKLGFTGFNEFQYQLAAELKSVPAAQTTASDIYYKVLQDVEDALPDSVLEPLARRILQADHLYLAGASFSHIPAEYLCMAMRVTGLVQAEDVDFMRYAYTPKDQDVQMLFSVAGGNSFNAGNAYSLFRTDLKSHKVLVTMNPKHPLKSHFNEIILLPDVSAAYGAQAVASETMAFLMFCDRLSKLMAKLKKTV